MPTQLIYQNTKQILHKGQHDQTVFVSTVNVQKDYGNWHLLLLRLYTEQANSCILKVHYNTYQT
jgi:hypothetical protein